MMVRESNSCRSLPSKKRWQTKGHCFSATSLCFVVFAAVSALQALPVVTSYEWKTSVSRCAKVPTTNTQSTATAEVCSHFISKTMRTKGKDVLGYHYRYAFTDTSIVDFLIDGDQVTCNIKVGEESCLSCSMCTEGFPMQLGEGLDFLVSADCTNIVDVDNRYYGRHMECEATHPFLYPLWAEQRNEIQHNAPMTTTTATSNVDNLYGVAADGNGHQSMNHRKLAGESTDGMTLINDEPIVDAGPYSFEPMACVKTDDYNERQCFPLQTSMEDDVVATDTDTDTDTDTNKTITAGELCVQIAEHPKNPGAEILQVSFEANQDYALLHAQFWMGDDLSLMPRRQGSGDPNIDFFRYFWCNSTGSPQWSAYVNFTKNCLNGVPEFKTNMVAHSYVTQAENHIKIDSSNKVSVYAQEYEGMSSTTPFSWLDFVVDCDCDCVKVPHLMPSSSNTNNNNNNRKCFALSVEDKLQQQQLRAIGSVCVEIVKGGILIITTETTSEEGWALIKNHLWLGQDIGQVPIAKNDELQLEEFTYFHCDFTGITTWKKRIKYSCPSRGNFVMTGVLSSTVQKTFANALLIPGTNQTAFAYEHHGGEDNPTSFSWFDFHIQCSCEWDETTVPSPTTALLSTFTTTPPAVSKSSPTAAP